MSNFSFINELATTSAIQKQVQDFFEYASTAENSIYSNPENAIANIRQGSIVLCYIAELNYNKSATMQNFNQYLSGNSKIVSLNPKMATILKNIENNTRTESIISSNNTIDLLKSMHKVAVVIFNTLSSHTIDPAFNSGLLEAPSSKKTNRFASIASQTLQEAFKMTREQFSNTNSANDSFNDQSAKDYKKISEQLKDVISTVNGIQENIVGKDLLNSTISKLNNTFKEDIQTSSMENKRILATLFKEIKTVQNDLQNTKASQDDLMSMLVIINNRLDKFEEKQDKSIAIFNKFTTSITNSINGFIQTNTENLENFGKYTRGCFEHLTEAVDQIKEISQEHKKEIEIIKKEFQKKRRPSILIPFNTSPKPDKNDSGKPRNEFLHSVMNVIGKYIAGKPNKTYRLVNALYVSFVCLFVLISFLFYFDKFVEQNFMLVKFCGLLWYFSSWVLLPLAITSGIIAILRFFATFVYSIYKKHFDKKTIKSAIKIVFWSLMFLLFANYVYTELYQKIYLYTGWQKLLVCKNADDIIEAINNVIERWGNRL